MRLVLIGEGKMSQKIYMFTSIFLFERSSTKREDNTLTIYFLYTFMKISCAWRHCGALADAEEALDELDHLVGVLEPYECLFCIDVIERSFRDILAVTKEYIDPSIHIPEYQQLQRMVR